MLPGSERRKACSLKRREVRSCSEQTWLSSAQKVKEQDLPLPSQRSLRIPQFGIEDAVKRVAEHREEGVRPEFGGHIPYLPEFGGHIPYLQSPSRRGQDLIVRVPALIEKLQSELSCLWGEVPGTLVE